MIVFISMGSWMDHTIWNYWFPVEMDYPFNADLQRDFVHKLDNWSGPDVDSQIRKQGVGKQN